MRRQGGKTTGRQKEAPTLIVIGATFWIALSILHVGHKGIHGRIRTTSKLLRPLQHGLAHGVTLEVRRRSNMIRHKEQLLSVRTQHAVLVVSGKLFGAIKLRRGRVHELGVISSSNRLGHFRGVVNPMGAHGGGCFVVVVVRNNVNSRKRQQQVGGRKQRKPVFTYHPPQRRHVALAGFVA